jgi:SAM-dependent methyltransferase
MPNDEGDVSLAGALALAESPGIPLSPAGWALGESQAVDLDLRCHGASSGGPARASLDAIVLSAGLERLPPDAWPRVFAACREALRADGTFVLRAARDAAARPDVLRAALARSFGAVELFAWDGLWRAEQDGGTEPNGGLDAREAGRQAAALHAICHPFLPYAMRSLELLRPRVAADGPEWRSSWLCERPALPARFLLRARVDLLGERAAGAELRLRFLAPGGRLRFEGPIQAPAGTAELLLSSALATARGDARWEEVERIALDVRSPSGTPLELRLSDVRIAHGARPRRRAPARASAELRAGYDSDYYRSMSGYEVYRADGELRERANVHRAYALLAASPPVRAVDVGCGRGELARHLLEQGSEVTLLDYSPAAIQLAGDLIGERPGARFIVDDAANLAAHVPAGSQQAIFMTDFVEHLSVEELRPVLRACRRALAPDGALVIHTPERYSGAVVTDKAIHGLHVTLFEIDTLAELLRESFGSVEVFTWNGFERFEQRGHCIELFAVARPERAQRVRTLPCPPGATAIDDPRLPAHFLLDATVTLRPGAAAEGVLEIRFDTGSGESVVRVERELARLATAPVRIRLASELLAPGGEAGGLGGVTPAGLGSVTPGGLSLERTAWEAVQRIAVGVRSPEVVEVAFAEVSLRASEGAHARRGGLRAAR